MEGRASHINYRPKPHIECTALKAQDVSSAPPPSYSGADDIFRHAATHLMSTCSGSTAVTLRMAARSVS
jgi:hypothetical protein